MGCCFSKKPSPSTSKPTPAAAISLPPQPEFKEEEKKVELQHEKPEKEERGAKPEPEEERSSNNGHETENTLSTTSDPPDISAPLMARFHSSSCSKEEVESILIQCGRLSRNSSCQKYSGSKRSHDFDKEQQDREKVEEATHQRRREGRRSRSCSHERRRTPSRERSSNGGRKLSQSPAKRSTRSSSTDVRRGKIVSVPASVPTENVCRRKPSSSPRSQSPVNPNRNPNSQQQPVLSRNSSRKAEQSPFRRNHLAEIDQNSFIPSNKITMKPSNQNSKNQIFADVTESKEVAAMESRSRRQSSDLDRDTECLIPTPITYNTRLLEDIMNFHRKNNQTPSSVAKACSIVEAIADLTSCNTNRIEKESDIPNDNRDLRDEMLKKYVTMKRGDTDLDQESSGSNSFISGGDISIVSPASIDSFHRWRSADGEGTSSSLRSKRSSSSDRMTSSRGDSGVSAIVAADSTFTPVSGRP